MVETIRAFAQTISKILQSDRWVFIVCDGNMGEGKSCITSQLTQNTAELSKSPFSYKNNMTFRRDELKLWLDGDENKKHQKPEYSSLLVDELISLFFKRNWYNADQIDGIELLNKCRDRHQCVAGNIPNFWDLDSAVYSAITFWIHVHERGRAWVFEKDKNPFATDKWHRKHNEKIFMKRKNPYSCKGFVCEIHFPDWTPEEKEEYYKVRNMKRINTEGQRGGTLKHKDLKRQRDKLIRHQFTVNPKIKVKDIHKLIPSLSESAIRKIKNGDR